jgi:hypothetical protein
LKFKTIGLRRGNCGYLDGDIVVLQPIQRTAGQAVAMNNEGKWK